MLPLTWAQPSGQGSRPQSAGAVWRMRNEGAGRRFGQVGAAERLKSGCPPRQRRARRDPGPCEPTPTPGL